VLAAVSAFGTSLPVLSEIVGRDEAFVKTVLKRLRKSKVLVGQTIRINWDYEGWEAMVAVGLDLMVASGEVIRVPDEKRSAAHKGKHSGPKSSRRVPTSKIAGPFSLKRVKSNPLYTLPKDSDGGS
jgi:hypothetical protein